MEETELVYTTRELAENFFHVSYGTFCNNKQNYLDRLTECYEWKYEKHRYILGKKKKDYKEPQSRHELIYENYYKPLVIAQLGDGGWNTATGVLVDLNRQDPKFYEKFDHMMSTAYSYVREALGREYNITERKYAACYGSGEYPRFMEEEEIQKWNKVKVMIGKGVGKEVMEITEQYKRRIISREVFKEKLAGLSSSGYVEALKTWIEEEGYIPVLINHYEKKKNEIESGKK